LIDKALARLDWVAGLTPATIGVPAGEAEGLTIDTINLLSATTRGAMPPRLLYVVTEDWYFLSHRLPMARAARDAGFEVHVATRVADGAAAIEAEGFTLHPVPFVRGYTGLR